MILHKPTLRRAMPLDNNRVKVLGTGAIEHWQPSERLELPRTIPATDEEIRLAVSLDLTIKEVRAEIKARGKCKCAGCGKGGAA
jgi:hypothetical protein